jgi:hypothetical protein
VKHNKVESIVQPSNGDAGKTVNLDPRYTILHGIFYITSRDKDSGDINNCSDSSLTVNKN